MPASSRPPHVAIDLRLVENSGIGTHLRNTVPRVLAARPEWRVTLLGDPAAIDRAFEGRVPPGARVVGHHAPPYSIVEQLSTPRLVPRDADLLWSPHYNIPLAYRGRLVVTLYDVAHLALPEVFGGVKQLYARALFAAVRRRADAIVSISEFSAREFERLVGPPRGTVHAVPLAVSDDWLAVTPGRRPVEGPYVLYVGNVKPHKNLVRLLRAFQRLEGRYPHRLVIVGKRDGFLTGDADVGRLAEAMGERVHFTGRLPDAELKQHFVHADALAFPSLYEGFGLPPLEAMAVGCPVASSNAASLPEACGDAALYFDPLDEAAIAAAIERVLGDASLRDELRRRGRARVAEFSWDTCAAQTLRILEEVLSR